MAKTKQEQLDELLKKQKQLKEKEKRIRSQISAEERKKRTKHLIEIGGLIYSKLGREYVDGDINRLANFIDGQENRGKYFSNAMNEFDEEVPF